jgi:hypothetical protein
MRHTSVPLLSARGVPVEVIALLAGRRFSVPNDRFGEEGGAARWTNMGQYGNFVCTNALPGKPPGGNDKELQRERQRQDCSAVPE